MLEIRLIEKAAGCLRTITLEACLLKQLICCFFKLIQIVIMENMFEALNENNKQPLIYSGARISNEKAHLQDKSGLN